MFYHVDSQDLVKISNMNVLDGTIEFLQDVVPNDASQSMGTKDIEASALHILRERFWNNKNLTWIDSGKSTGILFCEEIDEEVLGSIGSNGLSPPLLIFSDSKVRISLNQDVQEELSENLAHIFSI